MRLSVCASSGEVHRLPEVAVSHNAPRHRVIDFLDRLLTLLIVSMNYSSFNELEKKYRNFVSVYPLHWRIFRHAFRILD